MLADQAKKLLAVAAAQIPPPPRWEDLTPSDARDLYASRTSLFGKGFPVTRVENFTTDQGVPVRLYDNRSDEDYSDTKTPLVMYFHGGGWLLGDLETHDALCRHLAAESTMAIASVDYPRSPESKHPAALQACLHATDYLVRHADDYHLDHQRLAVAGDSAGGHLAACTAIAARDAAAAGTIDWHLRLQVLLYPVIEPNFQTDSYNEFAEGYGLTRSSMQYFWRQYLGQNANGNCSQDYPPNATPSSAQSLAGLPPAYIQTAGYDVLRDEGQRYAEQLSQAGVATTHRCNPGMIHGYIHSAGFFDDGVADRTAAANALKDGLAINS